MKKRDTLCGCILAMLACLWLCWTGRTPSHENFVKESVQNAMTDIEKAFDEIRKDAPGDQHLAELLDRYLKERPSAGEFASELIALRGRTVDALGTTLPPLPLDPVVSYTLPGEFARYAKRFSPSAIVWADDFVAGLPITKEQGKEHAGYRFAYFLLHSDTKVSLRGGEHQLLAQIAHRIAESAIPEDRRASYLGAIDRMQNIHLLADISSTDTDQAIAVVVVQRKAHLCQILEESGAIGRRDELVFPPSALAVR